MFVSSGTASRDLGPFLALDARSCSGLHERHLAVARFLIENNANVKAEKKREHIRRMSTTELEQEITTLGEPALSVQTLT